MSVMVRLAQATTAIGIIEGILAQRGDYHPGPERMVVHYCCGVWASFRVLTENIPAKHDPSCALPSSIAVQLPDGIVCSIRVIETTMFD
jgi:hypothetical protein